MRASLPVARGCGTMRSATPGAALSTSSTPKRMRRLPCSWATPAAKGSTCVPWAGVARTGRFPTATGHSYRRARSSTCPAFRRRRALPPATISRGSRRTSLPRPVAQPVAGFDWLELHCAHGYLLSSLHLAAHQPARRRIRRRPGRPLPLPARSVRGDPGRVARGQARQRAHLGARLGRRRHHAGRRRRNRRACSRLRART